MSTESKRAWEILKHLIQMFLVAWRNEEVRLAKNNLYRYIGCIIYQSNWSGPFSLVVMTPDLESGDRGSRPGQVESFYLQVYISPPTTIT